MLQHGKMDSCEICEYVTSHCRTEDSCSDRYEALWVFGGCLLGM